jgi:hypothetical protein
VVVGGGYSGDVFVVKLELWIHQVGEWPFEVFFILESTSDPDFQNLGTLASEALQQANYHVEFLLQTSAGRLSIRL